METNFKPLNPLKVAEKTNWPGEPKKYGETITIDPNKLIGHKIKSLYIREGFKHKTLFLTQRGGRDITSLMANEPYVEVNTNLFDRIKLFAERNDAILN